MIIRKLRIHAFGKIKDLEVDLIPGLNIIYGENEAGKSTIQAFIKAMFYGMNSKKQDIRENDRKRFLPWSGEYGAGEIYFDDDYGNQYILKRKFGLKRREDDASIIHGITGDKPGHIDPFKPGEDIFGITEEAFEKTIFIKQLGSHVGRDKEDEIMKHLTNLHQSADQDISYGKTMEILLNGKKSLLSPRKIGKLDKLREEYGQLQKEHFESLILHEKNLEDQIKLNEGIALRRLLGNEIEELENQRKDRRSLQLKREYEQLRKHHQRILELTKEREEIAASLQVEGQVVGESFLEEFREKFLSWKQMKEQWAEVEGKLKKQEMNIKEMDVMLEPFNGPENLKDITAMEMTTKDQQILDMENRLKQMTIKDHEVRALEEELIQKRRRLGHLTLFESVTDGMELEILNLEEQLKALKNQMNEGQNGENQRGRLKNIKDESREAWANILVGFLMMIGGLALGITKALPFYGVAVVGLLLSTLGIIKRGRKISKIKKLKNQCPSHEQVDIQGQVHRTGQQLEKIYGKFGVLGYPEFRASMRKYNDEIKDIRILEGKLEVQKNLLDPFEVESLKRKIANHRQFMDRIFKDCGCENLEEYMKKRREFQRIVDQKTVLEKEILLTQQSIGELLKKMKGIENSLSEMIKPLGIGEFPIDQMEDVLYDLSGALRKKTEIERSISSTTEIFHALLKDRKLQDIEKQLEQLSIFNGELLPMDEESLEVLLKEKQQQLIGIEKQIKDMEYRMDKRFHGIKTVSEIEEEMELIHGKIGYYQDRVESLDEAINTLEQSFKEIQRNFGPRLNARAGDILAEITAGKYHQLKISENYEMKIVDSVENEIRDVDFFSNGTWDQVYFALRLGIVGLIFGESKGNPLLLDDAFVQYDDSRLKGVFKYLDGYRKKHQVILFTCQKRELSILEDITDIHRINL